ncbi:MAG: HD domain-containing protein [Nanoarchaeota archaeon]|nr:HD domain-containing protein [Nanoarchaeota archaeon]
MKIDEVRKIAKEKYDKSDYHYHILPVVKNALLLADKLKADKEVIEIAAWLHDIGRAISRNDFEKENEHHIVGEKESIKILNKLGYEKDFIRKVSHCVLTHRGRKEPDPETIEAKIVSSADAMAHFDTFLDLFRFFLTTEESFEKAVIGVEAKINRNWNKKMIPEAKEMVKDKYDAIILLIKNMKQYF